MSGKRELKRIDWSIVKRLIMLLKYNQGIKKTHIAMKSGLSYDKCILYLNWMQMMSLIEKGKDEYAFEVIHLSQHGNELYEKFFKEETIQKRFGDGLIETVEFDLVELRSAVEKSLSILGESAKITIMHHLSTKPINNESFSLREIEEMFKELIGEPMATKVIADIRTTLNQDKNSVYHHPHQKSRN